MAHDRAPRPAAGNDAGPPQGAGQPSHGSLSNVKGGTYFLGRYRVVDEIGVGGMASVHLARMDGPGGFQKWVAIKRIHPHLVEDDSFVHMFLDEARVAARISHPNVATVFELGKHEDTYWIAMEYLHGEPLREVMRRTEEIGQPMPPEIACRVIADASEGLHAAHELLGKNGEKLGLVHRDVTPHNLFVTYDGNTKVVDFGIAKFSSRMASTRAGTLKGKLAYMSPEQVQGEQIDRRTDIFALGVVLWELTTGQRLFRMESDLDTLAKVQECNVPRPSSIVRGYPIDLEKIVMKALAKNKNERFRTARELSRALQSLLMRRGLFVAADEVAAYTRTIFTDRIRKREAHLRWAAEVTQTFSLDTHQKAQPKSEVWDTENSSVSQSSDVQAAPSTTRGVPRPAAGAPAQAHNPPSTVPPRKAPPNADTVRPPGKAAPGGVAIPPAPAAPRFDESSRSASPRSSPPKDVGAAFEEYDDMDDTIVQAPLRLDGMEGFGGLGKMPTPIPAAGRPAGSKVPLAPPAAGSAPSKAPPRAAPTVPPAGRTSFPAPKAGPDSRRPNPMAATQPAGLKPVPQLADIINEIGAMRSEMETQSAMVEASHQSQQISSSDARTGLALSRRTKVQALVTKVKSQPPWILASAAGALGLLVVTLLFVVIRSTASDKPQATATATTPAATARASGPFASAKAAFSTALAVPPSAPHSAVRPPPTGTGEMPPPPAPAASSKMAAAPVYQAPAPQAPAPAAPRYIAPAPQPVRAAPQPVAAAAPAPKKTEAVDQGFLTVVCMPACDQVIDNGKPLGPSPLFKKQVPVGEHRLKLIRTDPPVTKVVSVIVTASSEPAAVRQSMTP